MGEQGLCLVVAWADGERPIPNSSVFQAALGIGLRSALGCNAVNRRKVEAGTQAFLMAVA